jgi:pimeloyl-ACP methyl ester carboxylesterase
MTAFSRHHEVRTGEITTFVAEAGEGEPIVLLHGNPDTHAVWAGVVERLATRYHCLAPDLPGFGATRAPRDYSYTLEHQGVYVRTLLDGLGHRRVHLVVHDIGGVFGLVFAAMHPERLRSLTVFNTLLFPDYRWHFWARMWRTPIVGELVMLIANRWLFVRELQRGSPHMPIAYARAAYAEFGPDTRRHVLRWYRAMMPSVFAGWDTRLIGATAAIPRLVVWGDLDPFIQIRFADRFGADVRHAPRCGHWVMLEDPELAADAIAGVVARASSSRSE